MKHKKFFLWPFGKKSEPIESERRYVSQENHKPDNGWMPGNGVKLSLESFHKSISSHTRMTYESPYPDEECIDIIRGFVTCMIGIGWSEEAIHNEFLHYLEEYEPSLIFPEDEQTPEERAAEEERLRKDLGLPPKNATTSNGYDDEANLVVNNMEVD